MRDGGAEPAVIEACPAVGGLTRSVSIANYQFDYTGHILHLLRYGTPAGVPYASLRDDDWNVVQRRTACFIAGTLVTAPVQYNLCELPPDVFQAAVASYDARPSMPEGPDASFQDYVVSGFGQYLSDIFLIPQNEKTMSASMDALSIRAVKRFFPPPDDARVRAGMVPGHPAPPEYNSKFFYPKIGGIERLVKGLADGIRNLQLGEEIVELDLHTRRLTTRTGRSWTWDTLFTSIPLKVLCERSGDGELRELARDLRHSSTIVFNLGVRHPAVEALRNLHWIYVPDRSIPFYRLGLYSNIGGHMAPPGCSAYYVEVGVDGEEVDRINVGGDLQRRVLKTLDDLGWVDLDKIDCCASHVLKCAYVHHTPAAERAVARIMERLEHFGVRPIGRYGQWDYTGMEDSIHSGIMSARAALHPVRSQNAA